MLLIQYSRYSRRFNSLFAMVLSVFSLNAAAQEPQHPTQESISPFSWDQGQGNLLLTSTYLWRGIPRTSGAAVQAQLHYRDASGLYGDFWTSNVEDGSEMDTSIGYSGKSGLSNYDIGARLSYFPQYKSSDITDFYFGLTLNKMGVKMSLSPDVGSYLEGFIMYPLNNWTLITHAGISRIDTEFEGRSAAYEDYTDYSVSLNRDIGGFELIVHLAYTNLDKEDSAIPADRLRSVISVQKQFTP